MPARSALMACVLVLGGLSTISAAYAGDGYGGFGPSDSGSQEAGSNPVNAAPAQEDVQPLPWLQQQSQNQPDNSSAWDQQGGVDDGSDVDDASGH
jgi:hypothetical protein